MSDTNWAMLAKYLHDQNIPYRCEADFTNVEKFAMMNALSTKKLVALLKSHSCFCDCETLFALDRKRIFPLDQLINLGDDKIRPLKAAKTTLPRGYF